MKLYYQISLGLFLRLLLFSPSIFAQEEKTSMAINVNDDLKSGVKVFDNEGDFAYFIADQLDLKSMALAHFLEFQDNTKDSIFQSLDHNKQVAIPRKYLYYFLNYNIPMSEKQQLMSKRIVVLSKDKVEKLSFDLKEGDHFYLEFLLAKGKGLGCQVEVLFNDVRIQQRLGLNKKESFRFDFIAASAGKVEVILRNFGFFRMEGDMEVFVKGEKEKISFQEIKKSIKVSQGQVITLQDTLFRTLLDEELVLSHGKNLKQRNTFERSLKLEDVGELLGFAFYLYPLEEKENLSFHRQVSYREDPLEDFAIKELKKHSFTYLQEFSFSNLDIFLSDHYGEKFWHNGQNINEGPWEIGLNKKQNYAFFQLTEPLTTYVIQLKARNRSMLYDQSIGIKMVLLHVKKFNVVQEVEVEEFEEYILISLI